MKNKIYILSAFILGALLSQTPDLISLYADHVTRKYQHQYCDPKKPNECSFDKYFYPYIADHPTLNKISNYFLLSEGPLYFIASGRCTNKIFYNPSASPDGSGKMTVREYFYSRCSHFNIAVSDLIWGK